MTMPIGLFEIQILMALIATACLFFVKDKNNYIDVIAGIAGTLFWWTAGLSLLGGMQSDNITYTGSWMMWILVGIGIVTALITITKIIDIVDRKNHTDMTFGGRF